MEMKPLFTIAGLQFDFAGRPLFDDFSLTLGAGITWLRGDNGAGKTTLLKLAAGALAPRAGLLAIDGIDSAAAPLAYRLRSHYCGGDTPALAWLTVRELLDVQLALYGPAGADAAALDAQWHAFKLASVLDQPVTTLSLGQHKKVQLALALALPVRLLLIDEPFNGLDADALAYLRAQLADGARLARQCIVLTSHVAPDVPLARTMTL